MHATSEDLDKFRKTFFPFVEPQLEEAKRLGTRFAYYTRAEVAASIIARKELWLRNSTVMNDFTEVQHGLACLRSAYDGNEGQAFKAILEREFPGLVAELEKEFNGWLPAIHLDTYLACVSQHLPSEDRTGRLSMWRAYGGGSGVALVFNGDVMFRPTDALGAYSVPVHYADAALFASAFKQWTAILHESAAYLQALGREKVKNALFATYRYCVLSTKHPGFSEEREWRVIASPSMYPDAILKANVEVVRGVPQLVAKLPLEDVPDKDLIGLSLPTLIDRIIVGPCQFPMVTYTAFYRLLTDAGVPNAGERIILSDIPLRHT